MGGSPYSREGPMVVDVAGFVVRSGITATRSELKCATSWAIAVTSSYRVGSQVLDRGGRCARWGNVRRSSAQMPKGSAT